MPRHATVASCSRVGHSSTTTATFSICRRRARRGIESSASATICSNRSRVTVTTGANGTASTRKFPLAFARERVRTMRRPVRRRYGAGSERDHPRAATGAEPGRRTGRIRCGERSGTGPAREAGHPGGRSRGRAPGRPGAEGPEGVGERRPRGDRSCDAAETTRGLLLFSAAPCRPGAPFSVVPGRYGAHGGRPCSTVSTRPSATRSPAAPRRSRSSRGAGSGKTRVLTRRIAWQAREGIDRSRATSSRVTFTRKAAGELRDAARAASASTRTVTAGTFHAIALAQLRRRADEQGHADARRSSTARSALLVPLAARPRARGRAARRRARVRDRVGQGAAGAARRLRARRRRCAARAHPRAAGRGRRVYRDYEREKRQRGLVDFDDLIIGCADVLERDAEFAGRAALAVPPPLRRRVPGREPGPVPAAARLARRPHRPLRRRRPRPGDLRVRRRRRRRTSSGSRRSSRRALPRRRGRRVSGSNYRSTPQVVHRRGRGARPARPASAAVARGRGPTGPLPDVTAYDTDDDEARGVARRAARRPEPRAAVVAHGGALPRQRAVGARSRRRSRRAGIPFRVRGGGRFLDRPEVQVALDDLRKTRRARPRAVRSPSTSPTSPPTPTTLAEERREHVDALVRLGHEYLEADGGARQRRRLPRVPADLAARRRRRRQRATTRSSCSRSTAPRASSSTPCSSPASNAASCRSRTPRPPRRWTRSSGCSTSRSAAPNGCCT